MADGSVKIEFEAEDSEAKKSLENVEEAAEDTAKGLDKVGDSAEDAGKGLGIMDVAAGDLVSNGVQNLIGGLKDTAMELIALAEETREYRDDMAKLSTAFTTAGHSSKTANEAYKGFYKILGESDRSVEAANHLAELTKNEKEVAQWSTIAAGVTAKFGDSLPIEGLTEAANETAKVGQVTGPLADALTWAGISEDEFNKKLAKCNSEQERATLITSTLNKEYEAAAAEYNELTKSTQDARAATAEMDEAQAAIGETIEPLTTAWTNMKAQAFEAMIPVVQGIVGAFRSISQWMEENPGKAEIIKAVVIALAAAFGVLAAALGIAGLIQLVTSAMASLGAVMAIVTSPITLIIAAVAALVAGFLYLWNNCEAFRNFFLEMWETIKTTAVAVWEKIVGAFSAAWQSIQPVIDVLKEYLSAAWSEISEMFSLAWDVIKAVWDLVQPYFSALWEAIKAVFAVVVDVLGGFFSAAWEKIKTVWAAVQPFFSVLWEGIKKVFSVVKDVLGAYFSSAWEAIEFAWSFVTGFFQQIWNTIKTIFSVVKDVLSGNFSDAWEKIKGIFSSWKQFFQEKFDALIGVFSGIKDKFFEVGDNIIQGIWGGIKAGWDWLVGKVKSLAGALFGAAEDELEINSPSKKGEYIGRMYIKGQGVGAEKEFPKVENELRGSLSGMHDRLKSTVSAENARYGYSPGVADSGMTELARAVGLQSAGINSLAQQKQSSANGRPIVLMLNGRELGRAVVDVGTAETVRTGVKVTGGAK